MSRKTKLGKLHSHTDKFEGVLVPVFWKWIMATLSWSHLHEHFIPQGFLFPCLGRHNSLLEKETAMQDKCKLTNFRQLSCQMIVFTHIMEGSKQGKQRFINILREGCMGKVPWMTYYHNLLSEMLFSFNIISVHRMLGIHMYLLLFFIIYFIVGMATQGWAWWHTCWELMSMHGLTLVPGQFLKQLHLSLCLNTTW